MTEPKVGDRVELWRVVPDSQFAELLREAHDYDPRVDLPPFYVETEKPHRTFEMVASISTVEAGVTVHRVLMKLKDA